MNWLNMAQDTRRGTLWTLVVAVMNTWLFKIRGISVLHENLLVFQEGMCLLGWLVG
jgi:hypothetical protein